MVTAPDCLATRLSIARKLPQQNPARAARLLQGALRFTLRAQLTSLLSAEWPAGAVTPSLMSFREGLPRGVLAFNWMSAMLFPLLTSQRGLLGSRVLPHFTVHGHQSWAKQGKLGGLGSPTPIPIAARPGAQLLSCVPFSFHHKIGS